MPAEE
jgi:acyl dehydratase